MMNRINREQKGKSEVEKDFNANVEDTKYHGASEETAMLAHLSYLQQLEQDENKRLEILDNKTSQIIAQTGIIFTLLSLLIPIIVNRIEELSIWIKVVLLIVLAITFFIYLRIISVALQNFNVKKFAYSRPHPKNVVTFENRPLKEFYTEVVNDLLHSLKNNAELNNTKADNLNKSYRRFKVANIFTGVLIILFSFSLFFSKSQRNVVSVNGNVEIEQLDSLISLLRNNNLFFIPKESANRNH